MAFVFFGFRPSDLLHVYLVLHWLTYLFLGFRPPDLLHVDLVPSTVLFIGGSMALAQDEWLGELD